MSTRISETRTLATVARAMSCGVLETSVVVVVPNALALLDRDVR